MKVISQSRGMGKTTALLRRASKEGGYIICANAVEADRISKQARTLGLDVPYPMTFDEFLKRRYLGSRIEKFHIDNADWLLQEIAGPVKVDTVTFTCDEPHVVEIKRKTKKR